MGPPTRHGRLHSRGSPPRAALHYHPGALENALPPGVPSTLFAATRGTAGGPGGPLVIDLLTGAGVGSRRWGGVLDVFVAGDVFAHRSASSRPRPAACELTNATNSAKQ